MPRAKGQHAPFNRAKNEVSGQSKMWASMRILRRFTIGDLVTTAGATWSTAKSYAIRLAQAGILARDPRLGNTPSVYRIIQNKGPLAPVLRRDGSVLDPNTQEVLAAESAHE